MNKEGKLEARTPSSRDDIRAETTAGKPSPTALPAVEECPARKCLEQIEANLHAYVITDPDCPSKVRDWVAAANCGARKALEAPCQREQLEADLTEALDALEPFARANKAETYPWHKGDKVSLDAWNRPAAVLAKHRLIAPVQPHL